MKLFIIMKKTIKVNENGLRFSLNIKHKFAGLIDCDIKSGDLVIPKLIKYKSREYPVRIIFANAFKNSKNINTIRFENDIQIYTIVANAFQNSKIKTLFIPSNILELKDGWLNGISELKEIIVMKNKEENIINYDDKFILSKSDSKKDIYDILHYSKCDIKNITIPPFVKVINSNAFAGSIIESITISPHLTCISKKAFYLCKNLKKIEIPKNSELKKIDMYAFSYSNIDSISLPCHLTQICEGSFQYCKNLKTVEIEKNSELQMIGKNAFFYSSLEKLSIPSSIKELKKGWCNSVKSLNEIHVIKHNIENIIKNEDNLILGKSNAKSDKYDVLLFSPRNTKTIIIPSFISVISSYSIELNLIEKIQIPSHVTEICEYAFYHCYKLKEIVIQSDSELKVIGRLAFCFTNIKCLSIPNHLTNIGDNAFFFSRINKIEIPTDSKLREIGIRSFYYTHIEKIFIPPHIRKINKESFHDCHYLRKVEIPNNSELQSIGKQAFRDSSIGSIWIPPHVKEICTHAFLECKKLQIIEISEKSELKSIYKSISYDCYQLFLVMIPAKMNIIFKKYFY